MEWLVRRVTISCMLMHSLVNILKAVCAQVVCMLLLKDYYDCYHNIRKFP